MIRFIHLQKVLPSKYCIRTTFRMSSTDHMVNDAKTIFKASVRAVQPEELIRNSVHLKSNKVEIQGKEFLLNKNVHMVSVGKAGLGMAIAFESLLHDHIADGIVAVPVGTLNDNNRDKLSKFKVFEGAQDNIPDGDALLAAGEIKEFVKALGETSLLFALISGGASALLPSPKSPLTLEEKRTVIKILASRGATIEELNAVRKRLSNLKGGGLAKFAKPAQVVSLILSDIIGDPIGLVASGPTVQNTEDPSLPLSIIEKYKLKDVLPTSAVQILEATSKETNLKQESFDFVTNFVIGNNTVALNAAAKMATELGYKPVIVTKTLRGLVGNVGKKLVYLVEACLQQQQHEVFTICEELKIEKETGQVILDEAKNLKSKGICLLFGGETTVEVKGKGIGGRNQELALVASLEMNQKDYSAVLLSAGTDGIDGPTDAAGAIATPTVIETAKKKGMNAENFLTNNDSYNFYNSLNSGQLHVKIGHSGTNVSDIIVIIFKQS